MPIRLVDAKVGMADKVDQLVVDEFRRGSMLLDALLFDNAVSPGTGGSTLTYGYTFLKTPSFADGRGLNSEYAAGEAIKDKRTTELKIFGGSFEVDRVLEDTAAASEIQFQLVQKVKAAKNKFHYAVINGDSAANTKDFDGLDKLISGSGSDYAPATAIDLSSAASIKANASEFVFEFSKFLETMEGKPTMFLTNARGKTVLNAVAHELKYYSSSRDEFGRTVDMWDGIPIVDLENYYDGTKTVPCVPIDGTTGTTAIYAVQIGLDGVHGISPKGDKIVKTYLPDMKLPGAVKKGEVEAVMGIVVKSTLKAGVFRNIKVK